MPDSAGLIYKYFPALSEQQISQFEQLSELYQFWNSRINVISRKDIAHLYERHVLHSLSIAKFISFLPDAEILDLGTGGGFPGIPLAILFPDTTFTLMDSVRKKLKVVQNISNEIKLKNIRVANERAESHQHKYDFIICRAVADIEVILHWSAGKFKAANRHSIPNGLICLKGGNLDSEIRKHKKSIRIHSIGEYFNEEFFKAKKLIMLPVS